ncbi:adenosylcobinamide kinase/adenosylcobinamide phosphate guanyltransferase [Thalassotalea insulae]|uniref:Bifunctional adenosylcobalamin biosynthesis protein n=1 Tax=Thalassotalea insulae TaxID=2056778 RepID=A0ABQ6GTI3_9GAMM|nr:bifunctional adenosylcobinamide kinase/adenosylcobinamide-phosphate guanylyltransferase [Thalassotalea insulae]GLX79243.1 adenosylcobinamide kinase/adenosylcobinamide phosphate guanyltransferase [Thalassotalea insulae]
MLHLVLGGARSGKSSFAEKSVLAQLSAGQVPIYIATAEPLDRGMKQRIAHHQKLRQHQAWQLIECPKALEQPLAELVVGDVILIDCLTLWLSNQLSTALLRQKRTQAENAQYLGDYLHQQVASLVQLLSQHPANITLVSNEIGLGVVPMGQETRVFVDHQGWMNQALAQVADKVTLVTAGIPLALKGDGAVTNG